MTRAIEEWHAKFLTMGVPANAMNCAAIVSDELYVDPAARVDNIANAMLAFKRVTDAGPPLQTIYAEGPWAEKFIAWFMRNQKYFECTWDRKRSVERATFRLRFSSSIDLRKDLPAALRGKFAAERETA